MPRKAKSFKSRQRAAQAAYRKGERKEANDLWRQIAADRIKLKQEKAAKRAAKKA